jgi:hypothetical protein
MALGGLQGAATPPGARGESIIPGQGRFKEVRTVAAVNLIRVGRPLRREGDRGRERDSEVQGRSESFEASASGKDGRSQARERSGGEIRCISAVEVDPREEKAQEGTGLRLRPNVSSRCERTLREMKALKARKRLLSES